MRMPQMMKRLPLAEKVSLQYVTFLLLLLFSLIAQGHAANGAMGTDNPSPYNFTFRVGNDTDVSLTFGADLALVLTVSATNFLGEVKLISGNKDVFTLKREIVFDITENTTFPCHMKVGLRGEYVGRSELRALSQEDGMVLGSATVNVYTPFRELSTVGTIILTIWLVISYVIMAAKVEPRVLKEKIKPPWGIIMGMVCQFILMPPLAFGLARMFNLTGALAIGLILVGTCPGGFFSNIEVLLLDCDIVLSLTMTTFSTFLAVGMMPLNLLIYAQPFVEGNGNLQTPFKSLLIQLCILVLPLIIGVPFFHRFETARKFCLKLVKPFTFILMVLGVVLYIPSQYYIFFGDWKAWTTSCTLPLFGAFLGMSIARIANFNYTFSITVAIETGCQNTLLAVSVAKLYYKEPESDIVAIIPLLISMVTGFEGLTIAGVYMLGRRIHKKTKPGGRSAENGGERTNQGKHTTEDNTSLDAIASDVGEVNVNTVQNLNPTAYYYAKRRLAHIQDVSVSAKLAQQADENDDPSGEKPSPSGGHLTFGLPAVVADEQFWVNNGFVIDQHVWL